MKENHEKTSKEISKETDENSKETLIVLYGGRSAEREVSVMSAKNVLAAVDLKKFNLKAYFISFAGDFYKVADLSNLMTNTTLDPAAKIKPSDIYEEGAIVFPVLHGPMGEDGAIQGFLEVLKLPHVGPNVLAASATMDKLLAKLVFQAVNIPQVPYVAAFSGEERWKIIEEVGSRLKFPVFVKPANMGSSVGITKVSDLSNLTDALTEAFKYDSRVVIEQGVSHLREIECGMLGNKSSLPGEVLQEADFYDYNSKYIDQKIINDVPAKISAEQQVQIRSLAEKAYAAINGAGLARCDFFLDDSNGQIYLNEINTIPGSTAYSMYPALWQNMGLSYTEVINHLVELAKGAFAQRESHLI